MGSLTNFGIQAMKPTSAPPTYTQITDALNDAEATLSGAEAHGLLCGLICVTQDTTDSAWDKLIPGLSKHPDSLTVLKALFAYTYQQISTFSLDFMLVLPDDETDINQRAEALAHFCQGLLTGLHQSQRPLEEGASADAIDALNDITEIAQMDHGDLTANEEDENAYVELVEYVRLAVLMLYHERHPDAREQDTSPTLLH
jgi:uncharacterized protein YgfB (UPF0149 family)